MMSNRTRALGASSEKIENRNLPMRDVCKIQMRVSVRELVRIARHSEPGLTCFAARKSQRLKPFFLFFPAETLFAGKVFQP